MRIFHTADVHVGLKFTRGYAENLQKTLIRERVAVVGRMADIANQEDCELLVVAGDLFDNLRVAKRQIRETAEALKRFQGIVAVLPGNHDFLQPDGDEFWRDFIEDLGERHLLLQSSRPYDLEPHGLPAVLYPGICTARHSTEHAIGWVTDAVQSATPHKIRVGVAHGSLDGLSPDFNGDYYPMTQQQLADIPVHLWLLGHTHIRFPNQDSGRGHRIFYPSTPEPDGFDCRHPGYAWIIDVDHQRPTEYRSVRTGSCEFHEITEAGLRTEQDLQRIRAEFSRYASGNHLVKLTMQGRLDGDVFDQLPAFRDELSQFVRHLEVHQEELLRSIRQADVDAEFTEGSFPHQLLSELAASEADPFALQLAYDLVREARQ